jgi:hypothetical protein
MPAWFRPRQIPPWATNRAYFVMTTRTRHQLSPSARNRRCRCVTSRAACAQPGDVVVADLYGFEDQLRSLGLQRPLDPNESAFMNTYGMYSRPGYETPLRQPPKHVPSVHTYLAPRTIWLRPLPQRRNRG